MSKAFFRSNSTKPTNCPLSLEKSNTSQIVRRAPQGGCDAVLEAGHIALENRHTYASFIDNGLIYIEWGGGAQKVFSFHTGVLQK